MLIPVNMAQPTQDALNALEDAVGDIDQYAAKELGYKNVAALHDAFMGLQVDSVASAIHQLKRGKGTIIADQTGIGKGRQAAAIIRWAVLNDKVPVFVTVKPSLFTDMHGDLNDIGSTDVHPFIMNLDESIKGKDDEKLYHTKPAVRRAGISALMSGDMPKGNNAVFMTYSQINVANAQRDAVTAVAPRAVFILDESHNAGGESNTGEFIKGVLDQAAGTVYLSATFAKRPDNMPVYFRTDIGEAVADDDTLMTAMENGGLPLQTVVSNNLVRAGQMFRRERSFKGINIETWTDSARREEHEALADATTEALRSIVSADRVFHNVFFKELQKEMAKEGKRALDLAGNQAQQSVDHTQFSSVVHNFVRQMLLGLNAQASADDAIAALQAGKKPLIAMENTMGSFLNEYAANNGLKVGDELGNFSYRTVLTRALDRTRYIVEKNAMGDKVKKYIPLSDLDPLTRKAYDQAQKVIDALDIDIPVSPIDWMRKALTDKGYTVGEVTGRNLAVDYSNPAKPRLAQVDMKEQKDKVNTTRAFNSGALDAIILNVAGSTGISLHSSEKFKDQRPRHMAVAQAAQDINIFMQMLGRSNRTGQVALPSYKLLNVDLPAVRRPTALLAGKMKSLNANTSSNTESSTSVDALDILNKYGDQVVNQYLADNPWLAQELDIPMGNSGENAESSSLEDMARKVTGRLALMPVSVQKSFYEDVERQYRTLIDYLNKTGQNELEPRTYDFQAEEVSSAKIFEGQNPATPFGTDAIYHEFSVKAQGKSMTPDEVKSQISENLAGKTPRVYVDELRQDLAGDWARFERSLYTDEQRAAANAVRDKASQFIGSYPVGTTMTLNINEDPYNGVVTKIESSHNGKTGNPFSMSKIYVTVAVNGPLREVTIPATQFGDISPVPVRDTIDRMFSVKAETRERAKIITGNLLAAYGELGNTKGTIISFTKADGTTEQGIMLPKSFTVKDGVLGGFRFRNGADAMQFLQKSSDQNVDKLGIATRDGSVRITPATSGAIMIRVPKSKSAGGKYFLDKGIRAVTGDFTSVGDRMQVLVPQVNAASAINAIMKKQAIYALPSMSDEAKSMFPGKPTFSQRSEDPAFRQDQRTAAARASDTRTVELQETMDAITGKWENSPDVLAVANINSVAVPEAVRREAKKLIEAGGAVPGGVFYDGKVFLFSDQIKSKREGIEVLMHEVLGHYGLRRTFGSELGSILDQLAAQKKPEILAMMRKNGFEDTAENRARAAEELLAELAQTQPTLGFVQRAIAAIRNWLRRNVPGFDRMQMTDADIIQGFILPARRSVEGGGPGGGGGRRNPAPGATLTAFSSGKDLFSSVLEREVSSINAKAQPAAGWLANVDGLIKAGKVKADEVEATGLRDWLEMQDGKVTKDAVREFLAQNGVRVTEVVKGGQQEATAAIDQARVELDALGYDLRERPGNDDGPLVIRREDGARFAIDEHGEEFATANIEEGEDGYEMLDDEAARWARVAQDVHDDEIDEDARGDGAAGTRYGNYVLPGGTNYREVLLTLPVNDEDAVNRLRGADNEADYNMVRDDIDKVRTGAYRSNHWEEKNILAHIRLNDRTDADGKRVLFVEELQSDWAQDGRKNGFQEGPRPSPEILELANAKKMALISELRDQAKQKAIEKGATERDAAVIATRSDAETLARIVGRQKYLAQVNEEVLQAQAAENSYDKKVPNAPFVGKTDAWLSLALKRIIKMAADEGYDRVAFVNGEQSADRYDLSKQVSEVSWNKNSGRFSAYDLNNDRVISEQGTKAQDLEKFIGKEMAERLVKAKEDEAGYRSLTGLDLKLGGEGMKTFYDSIVPKVAKDVLKKMGGGKMDAVSLNVTNQPPSTAGFTRENFLEQIGFDVTPAMRDKVAAGVPMFSQATAGVNQTRDYMQMAREPVEEFMSSPGRLNGWFKTVGTPYHLAQKYPQFKVVFDRVQNFLGDVSAYAQSAADMAPTIIPKLEHWRDLLPKALGGTKSPMSAEDTTAIKAPIYEGTLNWTREGNKPVKIADLEARAASMSAADKGRAMLRAGKITEQALKMWQGMEVDQFEKNINTRYEATMLRAGIVWTPDELKSQFNLNDKQIGLYQEFRNATDRSITNMAISDMVKFAGKDLTREVRNEALAAGDVMLAAMQLRGHLLAQAEKSPKRNNLLIDSANRIVDKADRATQLMNEGYAPLMRFGHYTVDVVNAAGEREFFGMYESAIAARRAATQLAQDFEGSTIKRGTISELQYKLFAGVTPETLELFGEMLGMEAGGDSEMNQAFQQYLKLAKNNRSAMKRLIERKGIAGYSEDVGRTLAGFIYSNARQTSANLHLGEVSEAVRDIDPSKSGQGELRDEAERLRDYVTNPQEEAQGLKALMFAQYLGGSIASAMVNMTQPFAVTMPYLSQWGGIAASARRMATAAKDAAKKVTGDEALDAALKEAVEKGIVAPQEVHQLIAQGAGKATLQSGDGTLVGNTLAHTSNALERLRLAWGKPFSFAELVNRRITFIAAYRTAIEQGLPNPAAFAEKAIHETQFTYNKGNKPRWARGAIGSTLFTFKQYSISYLEMVQRLATAGEEGSPERAAGRKAALFAMGMLLLMGGAGGLPFVEDVSDVVEGVAQRLGYNLSVKTARRKFLNDIFGEVLADLLEKGISGLPGAPMDVSGRLGMGNLIPATGLFQKKTDHTRDVTELAGPAGDLASRGFQGLSQAAEGNIIKGGLTASPKAISNLMQAWDMASTGMYRDQSGKKVIDTTAWDAATKAIGFQPNDVAKVQSATAEVQKMVAQARLKESEIAAKWAQAVFDKDVAVAQSAQDELRAWNAANPESPIKINYRTQVLQRVREMNKTKAERLTAAAPKEIRETVKRELAGKQS